MTDSWHELEQLFEEGRSLDDRERQNLLTKKQCNTTLSDKLRALWRAIDDPPENINTGAGKDAAIEMDMTGRQVGRYLVGSRIGKGAMGTVYLAEHDALPERDVAVKFLRLSNADPTMLNRFLEEQHILARLHHPGIATIHDCGLFENRPFFVMERLQPGLPVTQYLDQHQWGLTKRLELFLQILDAVEFAHLKAIIHRDLKPSNILITEIMGRPCPKIIDFGIARRMDGLNSNPSPEGTPGYMSPEQALCGDLDIRSDIYSLGVLLFEIVTGFLPGRFPQPLASREIGSGEINPSNVKGDLDWIILQATHEDREERYSSVKAFAEDIRAFLQKQPISRMKSHPFYLPRMFYAKHRLWVKVFGSGILMILFALMIALFSLRQATLAERETKRKAILLEEANRFLVDLFQQVDPLEIGSDIRVDELLDWAGKRVTRITDLDSRARTHLILSDLYKSLGDYTKAESHCSQAITDFAGAPGIHEREILIGRSKLGGLKRKQKAFSEAESLLKSALALQETALGEGSTDVIDTRIELALLYYDQKRPADAKLLIDDALKAKGSDVDSQIAVLRSCSALIHEALGDDAAAQAIYEKLLPLQAGMVGPFHGAYLASVNNYANLLFKQGDYDKAIDLFTEVYQVRLEKLGADSLSTLSSLNDYARACLVSGRYGDAIEAAEQSWKGLQYKLGDYHDSTLLSLNTLAVSHSAMGNDVTAIKLLEPVLKELPMTHTGLMIKSNYASYLAKTGSIAQAESLLCQILKDKTALFGVTHTTTLSTWTDLCEVQLLLGCLEHAQNNALASCEHHLSKFGPDHPRSIYQRGVLGLVLTMMGEPERGRASIDGALKLDVDLYRDSFFALLQSTEHSFPDQALVDSSDH